jgi:ribokinase
MDLTVLSGRLPGPGETVTGGTFIQSGGGKGANQAVAAARAGAAVDFVGRIGNDTFGRAAVKGLAAEGIGTEFVTVDREAPSGIALIMVGAKGENLISVASGANARLGVRDVRRARRAIEAADALLVQLEVPLAAVQEAVAIAAKAGKVTVLNPAPVPSGGLPRRLMAKVSVLTPNRTEAAQLAGAAGDELERTAGMLLSCGVKAVALTLGADGVLLCDEHGCTCVPAAPARPIDTVGAGDCFAAVLAVAVAEGKSLVEAARLAVCAAAISTERKGAQPSFPTRSEIEGRLRRLGKAARRHGSYEERENQDRGR